MSKHLLQIDTSKLNYDQEDDDIVTIKFKSDETLQFNFSKLFNQSKNIRNKYNYREAINMIQTEIEKVQKTMQIKEESIKLFIQYIQQEKVTLPINHYRDFYTISEYFGVPKLTRELDNISHNELFNDLNFTIQTLFDITSLDYEIETSLSVQIEYFLSENINECIGNSKFGELAISSIFRILSKSDKENINADSLVKFILASIEKRFILLQFVNFSKLSDDDLTKFIEFVENQREELKKKCVDHAGFNFSFIKQMKCQNENLKKEVNQAKEELKQVKHDVSSMKVDFSRSNEKMKDELDRIKIELNRTKKELDDKKIKLEQAEDEVNRMKSEVERCAQRIIVGGYNNCNGLGENQNNKGKNDWAIIAPPLNLSLDIFSLNSYSANSCHFVAVTRSGSLYGVSVNEDGRISGSLIKIDIKKYHEFSINDDSGRR